MDFNKQNNRDRRLRRGGYNEKIYTRVILWVARIFCIAVLAGCFVVAGLLLGAFNGLLDGAPEVSLDSLAITTQTSSIYDANGNKLCDIQTAEQRKSITFDQMPDDLKNAVVAIEDNRFYQHNGVDLEGILRAGLANLKAGGTAEGGSTITQQMIKKMVLTPEQTMKRKVQEWYLALKLEDQMYQVYGKEKTKQLILESYLNYNYLGNNCYGVEAASERYFGKKAKDLTLPECALIAGLFNAPSAYDPIVNYDNTSRERQMQVLNAMLKYGYISQEQFDQASQVDVIAEIAAYNQSYTESEDNTIYTYFEDAVIEKVQKDLVDKLGYSEQDAFNALYYGGLQIYCTMDPGIQSKIDAIYADESNFQAYTYYELNYALTVYDPKDPTIGDNYSTYGLFYTEEQCRQAAAEFRSQYVSSTMQQGKDYIENIQITEEPQYSLTVIDWHTGAVVGMGGGRGPKTTNLSLNRAIDSTRQPGSTFKIIASYSAAIDDGGKGCASVEDDAPITWGNWQPVNWWGDYYKGFQTMREAITNSENVVTARFMRDEGVETNFEYAEKYGFTTLRREPDENGQTDMVGSLCLGSASVTNEELCAAYSAIANGGVYQEPLLYTKILDKDGNLFYDNSANQEKHRVIKETTAWMLTDMMKDVVTTGTGTAANFDPNMAIAGKTGTSSDHNDFSFVGFTPYYCACVMAGFDYVSYPSVYYNSMDLYSINPNGADLLDDTAHKNLWATVMSSIHEGLDEVSSFPQPDGLVQVTVCRDSGLLPGPYCDQDPRGSRLVTDWFAADSVPTETCDRHIALTVCSESGKLPTKYCPSLKTGVFIVRSAAEIAEIGVENLSKIQDAQYCVYPSSAGAPVINSDDSDTNPVEEMQGYYAALGTCPLHKEPPQESSTVAPLESSKPSESSKTSDSGGSGSEGSSSPNGNGSESSPASSGDTGGSGGGENNSTPSPNNENTGG